MMAGIAQHDWLCRCGKYNHVSFTKLCILCREMKAKCALTSGARDAKESNRYTKGKTLYDKGQPGREKAAANRALACEKRKLEAERKRGGVWFGSVKLEQKQFEGFGFWNELKPDKFRNAYAQMDYSHISLEEGLRNTTESAKQPRRSAFLFQKMFSVAKNVRMLQDKQDSEVFDAERKLIGSNGSETNEDVVSDWEQDINLDNLSDDDEEDYKEDEEDLDDDPDCFDSSSRSTIEPSKTTSSISSTAPISITSMGKRTRHGRIHTKEKRFECRFCQKRFNRTSNLKTHERIHTNEKPFECRFCQKRFNQTSSLKRHERIHTNEKPFECRFCQKRFNHTSNLKKHERIHTRQKPF
ncbi:hypothetical protein AAMO2058_000770300 [Amorphochlora amoebiformis]